MNDRLHHILAIQAVGQRTREAEARARLRWDVDAERGLAERIRAGLAPLGRITFRHGAHTMAPQSGSRVLG